MTSTSEPAATGAASSRPQDSQRLNPATLDAMWDFADPGGSEQRLRQAIEQAHVGSTAHAELTTQLARSLGLQGHFDAAGSLLDVVALTARTDPVVGIRLSLERGRLLNSAGSQAAATGHFIDALGARGRRRCSRRDSTGKPPNMQPPQSNCSPRMPGSPSTSPGRLERLRQIAANG